MSNFFTNLKEIERKNKELFENVDLGTLTYYEASVISCELYKKFILSFHYPHEVDSPYIKNEFKNNVEPFNLEK